MRCAGSMKPAATTSAPSILPTQLFATVGAQKESHHVRNEFIIVFPNLKGQLTWGLTFITTSTELPSVNTQAPLIPHRLSATSKKPHTRLNRRKR